LEVLSRLPLRPVSPDKEEEDPVAIVTETR
jgi:hypothetical protein